MYDEFLKTYKRAMEFWLKVTDPRTYLRELTPEEIQESISKYFEGSLKIMKETAEYSVILAGKMMQGDPDEVMKKYLEYISKLEDTVAEMANTPLYSAYINALNRIFLGQLYILQRTNSAILHSLGIPSRDDVVALAEAYVDLKGDIKRESRMIRREIRRLATSIQTGGEEK